MNPKSDTLITVLDAGSSKSCVMVAELADGVLRYRGHGIEAARGMRDRKSTRLNSSHLRTSRMPSSA